VPQLNNLEGALDDRAPPVRRDGGRVVGWLEDQDEAAVEAGSDEVDGLLAAGYGEVDDHRVDVVGGQGRPRLEGGELGDAAGAVEQRSQGEAQRGVASKEHDMAEHQAGSLPG
jgi:hypothetical protein